MGILFNRLTGVNISEVVRLRQEHQHRLLLSGKRGLSEAGPETIICMALMDIRTKVHGLQSVRTVVSKHPTAR
jgi:hypothetical protein